VWKTRWCSPAPIWSDTKPSNVDLYFDELGRRLPGARWCSIQRRRRHDVLPLTAIIVAARSIAICLMTNARHRLPRTWIVDYFSSTMLET
jgi:hypothetical protein